MPHNYQIKQTVQFAEQTAVVKEMSGYALFDIIQEDILDNALNCLMDNYQTSFLTIANL
jgi:hypothetical protein